MLPKSKRKGEEEGKSPVVYRTVSAYLHRLFVNGL